MTEAIAVATFLVAGFLAANGYPWATPESALLLAGVGLCLGVAVFFISLLKKPWLTGSFLTVVLLDVAMGADRVFRGSLSPKVALAALAALSLFAAYLLRASGRMVYRAAFTAAAGAAVLSAVFFSQPLYRSAPSPFGGSGNGLPNLYVFILDEHLSPFYFPQDLPESTQARQVIEDLYAEPDFKLFLNAYSNHNGTFDSIPGLLHARVWSRPREGLEGKALRENPLFKKWEEEGYRIFVYQNTHLDFVSKSGVHADKVWTYLESAAGYARGLPLGILARARVLFHGMVENSRSAALRRLYRFAFFPHSPEKTGGHMLGAVAVPRLLEEMKTDVRSHPSGNVFFAHLLSPHSHYLYRADGSVANPGAWEGPFGEPLADGRLNTEQTRLRKYKAYLGQVVHLHRQLAEFFDFLKKNGLWQEARIVLFSDHGSRIQIHRLEASQSWERQDLRDAFASFLAVKDFRVSRWNRQEPIPTSRFIARWSGLDSDEELLEELRIPGKKGVFERYSFRGQPIPSTTASASVS